MPRPAHFNDGRTAQRHEVALEIEGDALVVADKGGAVMTRWPLADIRRIKGDGGENRIRLECADQPARLTLPEDDDGRWLTRLCPNLQRRGRKGARWPVWIVAVAVALASLAGIFFYLIPGFAGAIAQAVPPAWEERIGRESRQQLLDLLGKLGRGDGGVCRNAQAEAILSKRAAELATLMESPFPITVTVVRFPVANALALPGGEVVILSGLIDDARSGDEVIGVLAHEIAHAVRRDPVQVSIKQTGSALLLSLLIGDVIGGAVITGSVSALVESGYSRDAEAAADFLAVTALNQLGLTARPLADFVERLSKNDSEASAIPDFLSTHPAGAARKRDIEALSQGMGRAMSPYDWRAVREMCREQG